MAGRRDIDRLHEELEALVDDLWRLPRFAGPRRGFRPQVDVVRTDDPPRLTVVVDLAGVAPEDVEIAVLDRTLVVTGERRPARPDGPCSYHQLEIEYGSFQRRVTLAENVDVDGAHATYERGLLTIVFPLAERPAPTARISISVRVRS